MNVNLCWLTAGSIKREGRREAVQFISTDSGSWSSEWIFPVGLPRSRTAPSFSVSSLPSIQLPTFWCRRFVPPRVLATQPGMRSGYRSRLRALAATGSTPGNSWHQGARQNPLPAPSLRTNFWLGMQIGDMTIEGVSDGSLLAPATAMFNKTDQDWLQHSQFLDKDGMLTFEMGGFLVRNGDRIALVDTGIGPHADATRTGTLMINLIAMGINPSDVTDIVLTHLHFDHLG